MTRIDPIQKNHVRVTGNPEAARTLIFCHGFGTDQTAWSRITPAFQRDFKIILFDNAGAGNADPEAFPPGHYDSLRAYARDLLDICAVLEVSGAILVGHSMSGMVGLLAAIQEPERFSKLAMIGASPRYLNEAGYVGGFEQRDLDGLYQAMSQNYQAWVSGFAPLAMANPESPELAEHFGSALLALRPDIALSVARMLFQADYRSELGKLRQPALILQTRVDFAVPQRVAQYLCEHIPDSRLVVVEATGHFPHLSAPEAVISALRPFIGG